ncbi:MAG TPA: DUF2780 domain-containing protein [Isosphaeraceae bacterium]|nr:DUF2780 domain-containing protein [Isosphaeraceae bacterium]
MSDIVNELAEQTEIPSDTIHKAVAALLAFLEKELGSDTIAQVKAAVPGAALVNTGAESPEEAAPQGGLLGTLSNLAGKILGAKAGGGAELLAKLSELGLKPEQIQAFLTKAVAFIKQHLSPELLQQVLEKVRGFAPAAGSETPE